MDIDPISWQICQPPPTLVQYLVRKSPFSLGGAVILAGIGWWFGKEVLAVLFAVFGLLVINVFLSFLAGAAMGKCKHYEINNKGISIDKKITEYSTLDKMALGAYLKAQQLSYAQWRTTPLVKNGELIIGPLLLPFHDQETRQRAINALLGYLG